MNCERLKDAFGSTPESIEKCVRRSLHQEQKSPKSLPRRMTVSLAFVLAMLLGCAAWAAGNADRLFQVFRHPANETMVNESAIAHIQPLNDRYEGKFVRFEILIGVVNRSNYGISWKMEQIAEAENLYITIREMHFGDVMADNRHNHGMNDGFFLDGLRESVSAGFIPQSADTTQLTLTFCVFEIKDEVLVEGKWWVDGSETNEEREAQTAELNALLHVLWENGQIPVEHGTIEFSDQWKQHMTRDEVLLSTGLAELVEQFTVQADLAVLNPLTETRIHSGREHFSFGGGELTVKECTLTPLGLQMECEILSDNPVSMEDGTLYSIMVQAHGTSEWCQSQNAVLRLSVPTERGDYLTEVSICADLPYLYPEELTLVCISYDEKYAPLGFTEDIAVLALSEEVSTTDLRTKE